MAMALNTSVLRVSKPIDAASYFRSLLSSSSNESITHDLINAVERGSIDPSVFVIWLGISRSTTALKQALQQNSSVQVRSLGIRRLWKELKSTTRWQKTWDGLGATPGLLELLRHFSANEIRAVCSLLGSCVKQRDADKRARITELLKSLLPRAFPNAPFHTADQRPLMRYYEKLASACTPDFITEIFGHGLDEGWKGVSRMCLLRNHADTYRNLTLKAIFGDAYLEQAWLCGLTQEYPATTGPNSGISATMQFSIDLLRKLAEDESSHISGKDVIVQIAEPLIRRTVRKKIGWIHSDEIFQLVIRYLDKHPDTGSELSMSHGSFLHFAAISWSRRSELFDHTFRKLLHHANKSQPPLSMYIFEPLLRGVAKSRRYPLLQFCYREAFNRDLDSSEDLKFISGPLPYAIWSNVYPDQALGLLARMRKVRGDDGLIESGLQSRHSVINTTLSPVSSFGDPDLIAIALTTWHGELHKAETLAVASIEDRKKKATLSQDSGIRAWYARSVLDYAVASGSLKLLKDAVLWARRFTRDPTAVPMLYMNQSFDMRIILSGIPEKFTNVMDPSSLRNRVEEGNIILKLLFEIACSVLREPWFSVTHWTSVLKLFGEVVSYRMIAAGKLKAHKLDDQEIFEILWRDTLKMLIDVERDGLKPGYDRLEANQLGGILDCQMHGESIKLDDNEENTTFCFLDQLGQTRDRLWKAYRPTIHPAATMLPDAYPKGLPIQALIRPYKLEVTSLDTCPYLLARANTAVYLDPATALEPVPTSEDMRDAIGPFIDDYEYALNMLITDSQTPDKRKLHTEAVWSHIQGSLTCSRMTVKETKRYWEGIISPPSDADEEVVKPWPVLPVTERPSEIEEWNPLPSGLKDIEEHELGQLTYVDLSRFMRPIVFTTVRSELDLAIDTPKIPGKTLTKPGIWDWERSSKIHNSSARRDGQIVSSLLYLDSQISPTQRILSTPYPSQDDVRYPSLFLDHQFLSKDHSIYAAIGILETHIDRVPPSLLLQVATNVVTALSSGASDGSTIELEYITFSLVSLLGKSDRPGLAASLAVETIIRYPDASSWHRQLLASGYFKRLPASDALACFRAFSDAIINKLEEQNHAKGKKDTKETSKESDDAPAQPIVKVTTVKLLAQLLRNNVFLPEDFSVDVLATLLQKASHVDVKQAVLDSLLFMMIGHSSGLFERVIMLLEDMIPVVSNLNERSLILDADWTAASASLILPEIGSSWQEGNSMLHVLSDFANHFPATSNDAETFLNRILIPATTRLKEEISKWTSIFLCKHGIDGDAQKEFKLPLLPGSSETWKRIITSTHNYGYTPVSMLEEYVEYLIFNINPPAPVAQLNQRLRANSVIQAQPDVKFWLSMYDNGVEIVSKGSCIELPTVFETTTKLAEGGFTTKQIQELFFNVFTVVLLCDSPHYLVLDNLIQQLQSYNFDRSWREYKKPVVQAMVAYVDTLRTKDWQSNPDRHPQVLPDMYPQHLWLLEYPSQIEDDASNASPDENLTQRIAACKTFADQLAKEIDRLPGTMYHDRFQQLQRCLMWVEGVDRIRVALHLGDINKTKPSWLTVNDLLRTELAVTLIGRDYGPRAPRGYYNRGSGRRGPRRAAVYRHTSERNDEEVVRLKKAVEGMVGMWRMSENEGVRKAGWAIELNDDEDDGVQREAEADEDGDGWVSNSGSWARGGR